MRRRRRLARLGATLLLAGGVLLVIGPFASWASIRPDAAVLAETLHETQARAREAIAETTVSYTWLEGNGLAGLGLVGGLVVVGTGVLAMRRPRRRAALVGALGACAAVALAFAGRPSAAALVDTAIADAAKYAVALGVDPNALRSAYAVTLGRYTTYEVVGGTLAVLGAIGVVWSAPKDEGDLDWVPWSGGRDD